ncbi:MAG: NADH-quinone oxidoreductase subunit NuoE [Chloroflexi bacterium]|nr:NADH-quinone oxidoreductase subunit NuoE [Chloroflexota bacterium]
MLSASARAEIAAHLSKYPTKRSAIIPALHIAQREIGWLPDEAMVDVAGLLDLQPTEVRAVAGFYSLYFKEKVGRHVIHFCNDLPCALRGADELMQKVCQSLGIEAHGTTADGEFTLEPAMCLAACDKAPMMQVDLDYFENLTEEKVDEILRAIRSGDIVLDKASVVRSAL